MLNILQQLVAAVERNEPAALATVVEVVGASPAKVGAKILVRGDGIAIIPEDWTHVDAGARVRVMMLDWVEV
jgi:hypothetical protein